MPFLWLVLDAAVLLVVTTLLAKQSRSDDRMRCRLIAVALAIFGALLRITDMPTLVLFCVYGGSVLAALRFGVGSSWPGTAVGTGAFMGYRLVALMF